MFGLDGLDLCGGGGVVVVVMWREDIDDEAKADVLRS